MFEFLRSSPPPSHPLLDALAGQQIIHTRVEGRGTWTITDRGWTLHSRIQRLGTDPTAVGLRDERLLGAGIVGTQRGRKGELSVHLQHPRLGPLLLTPLPPWRLSADRGAMLSVDASGDQQDAPPGPPRFATPQAMAEHAASAPSSIEERLLAMGRERWLHPGDVVELLAGAGALRDEEFESRGPLLLSRMLVRGQLRAGTVREGRFTAWDLPAEQIVEHIGTTWAALGGRTPGPDMIAWFELTGSGRDGLGPTSAQAMPPGMSGYDSPGVVGGFR